jgi:photosystem II stability/assembly factor-like uncharacterized protein
LPDTPLPSHTPWLPTPTVTPAPIPTPLAKLTGGAQLEIRWIEMLDDSTGWGIGGVKEGTDHILITSDGAATWKDVSPMEPWDPETAKSAIGAFLDSSHAWVIYSSPDPFVQIRQTTIWRTQNAGLTWEASQPLDISGLDIFIPKYTGFASASDGWLMIDLGGGMMHEYIALYTTHDAGRGWTRVLDPFGTAPVQGCDKTGVTFFDSRTGWMTRDCHGVVEGLTLESTLDGGSTWISLPLPTPTFVAGAFDYPNFCWVHSPQLFSDYVGALAVSCQQFDEARAGSDDPWSNKRSYLYRTEDGGGSWTISAYPGGELRFLSPEQILAVGRTISISTNAGVDWRTVKTVAWDGQFSFVDLTHAWAVARSGDALALVQTTSGGRTWQELHPVIQP